jgi:hypothetical protein
MRVKLRIARWKFREERANVDFVHEAVLKETEDVFRAADIPATKMRSRASRKNAEYDGVADSVEPATTGEADVEEKWIARQAHLVDAPRASVFAENFEDGGMKMEMEMAIDMIERKAGGFETIELGGDFPFELGMTTLVRKIAKAGARGVVGEVLIRINEVGNFGGWKRGSSVAQSQMEANPEAGMFAREGDRFVSSRAIDHEAGRGEDAALVGFDDSAVDGMGASEIVGVYN